MTADREPPAGAITLRAIDPARDAAALRAFDASYVTDRVYVADTGALSLGLAESRLQAPFHKRYPFDDIAEDVRAADLAQAALDARARIVGFVLAEERGWNASLQITGLFVAPGWRGRGLGGRLLRRATDHAAARGIPRLRLETQNTNFAAVNFYRKAGFRLCGIDLSLYDPAHYGPEFALHFDRETPAQGAAPPAL
ncbi:GNAT family N-acetyltransferase [Luteimonas aquatica]|uniref:GNAT family N-acetyltransferase n=1 Tax=Luteimonas aquatica TaxID=450364 RepID=UPI001F576FFC|nr:GNAT family N-acetyltransferase [Luteimonas aquatica]